MTLLPGLIDVHFHFNALYEIVPLDQFRKTIHASTSEEGIIDATRLFPGGNMISITDGHADISTGYSQNYEYNYRHGVSDGVPEALKAVRYQIKHDATWTK